jgi:hypothetical protein
MIYNCMNHKEFTAFSKFSVIINRVFNPRRAKAGEHFFGNCQV